ncbi:hypothetical protein MLD38_037986 [Melastoma candidum]|uniref:Uncharacterized protein n=1 Tax=Melastoma candidum TaxID=119954 RepID=A0ACB9KY33_9MYRT|nr:hypothetical protein MLD38_037986 [Melastoma candidum]
MYSSGVPCCGTNARLYLSLGKSHFASCPSRLCCCYCYGHGAAYGLGLGSWVFYGLRQSSLIRRSVARKVVLAGWNGCHVGRFPECGLGDEVSRSYGGSSLAGRRKGRDWTRRREVKCLVSGEERVGNGFSWIESVEAIISLLSEEVGDHCLDWRDGDTVSGDRSSRKKRNENGVHSKGIKKESALETGKSQRGCKVESIEVGTANVDGTDEWDWMRERGREAFPGRDKSRTRREGSHFSLYQSVLSSGDYEDDVEELKRDKFSDDALGRYSEESRKAVERKMKKEMWEDHEQHEEKGKISEVIRHNRESESSFIDWDRRKNSEKKLGEFSSNEVESSRKLKEESISSRMTGQEDVGPFSSHLQFHGGEQKSRAGVTIHTRTENHHKHKEMEVSIGGETVSTNNGATELCRFCGSDVKPLSPMERQQQIKRKDDMVVSGALVAERNNERDGKKILSVVTTERRKFVRNPRELSVELDIRGTNSEINTESSRSSHARLNSTEVEEKQRKRFGMNEVIRRDDQSGKSKQLNEHRWSHYDVQRTSLPQIDEAKNSPQQPKLVSNMSENRIVQSPPRHPEIEINKHFRQVPSSVINQSVVRAGDTRLFNSYERISDETTFNNNNFTSVVVLPGEVQEKDGQPGGRDASIGPKIEQGSVDQPSFLFDSSQTSAHEDFDLFRRSRARNTDRKNSKTGSHLSLISHPQLVQRESSLLVRTDESVSPKDHYVLNPDTSITYEGACNASLHCEYDSGKFKYQRDDQPVLTTDGGGLEYALHLDEASRQFLDEFVEQTKHAVNSDVHVTDAALDGEVKFDGKTKNSSEIVSESALVEDRDKTNLSEGPETKDPSDDIWHDTNTSIQEIPKSESPEELTAHGNTIVKRSGGNLWKIIGDFFRIHWVSARSMVHSGGRNSSSASVSSETWFSGPETEENIDIFAKSRSPEAAAKQWPPVHMSIGEQVDTRLGDREQLPKAEISLQSVTRSDLASSSDIGFVLNKDDVRSPPVTAGLLESSLTLPEKGMTASVAMRSSSGGVNEYGGELLHVSEESTDGVASEVKNGELKHRKKLLRKQQLPRDRFDEWEEAYQLEREQRQIDESFMREALVEAKKESDNWEVPVGAVLVQHGKIIARGCNLVEELRDSTAHAEMICIREASSVLQSWRLAETTLYVTLEPCTMCAGAILQAGVGTLVWGAPNKLLGADGSYVRLFPVGEEGSRSSTSDKPAPPVHPFHPKMTIRRGILASECEDTMHQFFQFRRRKKEKKEELAMQPSGHAVSHHPSKLTDKMHHIFHILFCI